MFIYTRFKFDFNIGDNSISYNFITNNLLNPVNIWIKVLHIVIHILTAPTTITTIVFIFFLYLSQRKLRGGIINWEYK
jgi:hypothetical protein